MDRMINAFYGRPSVFTFEGMIWFEDTKLTADVNPDAPSDPGTPDDPGAAAPDTPPAAPSTLTPGEYARIAREEAGPEG